MGYRQRIAKWFVKQAAQLGSISVVINDKSQKGWNAQNRQRIDSLIEDSAQLYNDAIEAWRKNPLAKRAVDITNDYVIGDGITIASPIKALDQFAGEFWHHRKNVKLHP
jgi:hypothetical protein